MARRRTLLISLAAVSVLVAAVVWKACGGDRSSSASDAEGGRAATSADRPGTARRLGAAGQASRVQGTVYDLASRKPLAAVDVSFGNVLGESTATSGDGGHYQIDLAAGEYRVQAIGDGVFGALPHRVTVRTGQSLEGIDVPVARLVTVRGRVVDSSSRPVADARISFSAMVGGHSIKSSPSLPIGEAAADEAGAFEIEVPQGEVKLVAEADEGRGEAVLGPITVEQPPLEVVIRLRAGAVVDGLVVDEHGAPVSGAHVRAVAQQGDIPERSAASDGAGHFRLEHLWPGKVHLQARAAGAVSLPVAIDVVDGATRTGLRLVLAAAAPVSGRVVDSKGAGIADAKVSAVSGRSRIKSQPITTAADGRFTLADLVAGASYTLFARKEGYATRYQRDVTAPADQVEIVLVSAGGIRGIVKAPGGGQVDKLEVHVERYVSDLDGIIRAGHTSARSSSKDGRFELDVDEPGQYEILVTAAGYAPLRPPRIAVAADAWAEVELVLAASSKVSGRVTSGGAPVAGARVAMLDGYAGPAVFTDPQGRYELLDVAAGRRSITASKSGLVTAHRDAQIPAGASIEVDLALGAAASGRGEGGVGLTFRISQGRPLVIAVGRGSAARAGVRRRDLLVGVDDVSTLDVPLDQVLALLRGPVGSSVRLDVEREGSRLRFEVSRRPE